MSHTVASQGFEYGVKHFYAPRAGLLTEIVFEVLKISSEEINSLLNLGAIYVNHERCLADTSLDSGTLLRVHTKPRRYNCDYDWASLIVFDCADFVVLNKPSGLPSHPSVDNILENSLTQLGIFLKTKLLITHRLDTLTCGLIVYAKKNEFVRNFNQQLTSQMVEKKYCARVETTADLPSRLMHYMEPTPRAPKNLSEIFVEGWALCELEILEQRKQHGLSWVKINLLTGRTHQIRSQLAKCMAPIVGDILYGAKNEYRPQAIALRACELQFNWGSQRLKFNLNEDFDI